MPLYQSCTAPIMHRTNCATAPIVPAKVVNKFFREEFVDMKEFLKYSIKATWVKLQVEGSFQAS